MAQDKKLMNEILKKVENLDTSRQKELLEIINEWQAGKQRVYQRRNTVIEIDFLAADKLVKSRSGNLSAGGVFIHTSGDFRAGQKVRVVFSIPGSAKPYKLDGSIVRVEKKGLAIEFENISPYFKEILDECIWKDIK